MSAQGAAAQNVICAAAPDPTWTTASAGQSPLHCPVLGPDTVLTLPLFAGAGEFPLHHNGPLIRLPATAGASVTRLFVKLTGPLTVTRGS